MAYSSNVTVLFDWNTLNPDIHIHNRDSESGLHILRLGVSLGAIHDTDSSESYLSRNCYHSTRKAARRIIFNWIRNESSVTSFFWLYGPARLRKVAIIKSIVEFLCSPSGSGRYFGGSFFFSREKMGRDQGHFLFSTIAYQLALKVPGLREHVNRIVELDPTLHTESMDVQLQTLIVDAFRKLSPPPQHSYLVIIDGLDECDKATQQSILHLLCESIKVHKLPLRFLIGSRPESHIQDIIDQDSLYTVTRGVDEIFHLEKDIRVFLQDGFAKIIPNVSQRVWPGEGIVDLLVQRSSGQFIYAATVLKFVGADLCNPMKHLALILERDPTDLDQLYTQILSIYPSTTNIVQVLGIILAFDDDDFEDDLILEVVEDVLWMKKGELKLVLLRGLSSLMEDVKNDEKRECFITPFIGFVSYQYEVHDIIPPFAHASFPEYLFDSSRSGRFHVNQQEYKYQITTRSFAIIMQLIRSWRMSSISRDLHSITWKYFSSHLPDRFIHSPKVVQEAIMTEINDLVQDFWKDPSDVVDGGSFLAMRHLLKILQECFDILEASADSNYHDYSAQLVLDEIEFRAKFKILLDGYQKMFVHWFGLEVEI